MKKFAYISSLLLARAALLLFVFVRAGAAWAQNETDQPPLPPPGRLVDVKQPIPPVKTTSPLRVTDIPAAALTQMIGGALESAKNANPHPRDKLPADAQRMRTSALVQVGHVAAGVNPLQEEERAGLRAERVKTKHPLGDMPLIVLARGLPEEHGPEAKTFEEDHRHALEELAAMSRNGKLVVATRSGHHIQLDEPELVIQSIRKVVLGAMNRTAGAQQRPVTSSHGEAAIAFVNVNVIPMDGERLETGQTVLVQGDRIVAIGARNAVAIPASAMVIEGDGRYLMPGLTDAHVHLTGTPLMPTRDDFGDAPIYLAYGVTTVVNMSGTPRVLEWRKRVADGALIGPTIYTAGPFVNEPRVNTPDEVERDIVEQAQLGYDLIKFHEFLRTTTGLSGPAYRRMVETARRIGIPLIGHAPVNLSIDEMLQARQSIAHVGMFLGIYFLPLISHTRVLLITAVASLVLASVALTWAVAAVMRRLSNKARRSVSAVGTTRKVAGMITLATVGAFVCAFACLPGGPLFNSTLLRLAFTLLTGFIAAMTLMAVFSAIPLLRDVAVPRLAKIQALLVVTSAVALSVVMLTFWVPVTWRSSDGSIDHVAKQVRDAGIFVQSTLVVYETFSTSGRTALINDPVVEFLSPSTREVWRREPRRGIRFNRLGGFMQKVVCALHRKGVPIMAGTDALGLPLVAPGNSLHREFQLLSASGLSPYEVIRSATVVPAAFLGKTKEFGTIATGKRADLLLVDGNPFKDVTRLRRPIGVMVRGRWFTRDELQQMLAALAHQQ